MRIDIVRNIFLKKIDTQIRRVFFYFLFKVRTKTFCELFCENWIWRVSKNLIPAQHWLWPNHSTYYNNNLLTTDIPMYNKTEEEIRRMFQLRIHKVHLPSGKHFENSNIESASWTQKIRRSTTQCRTQEVSWKIDC